MERLRWVEFKVDSFECASLAGVVALLHGLSRLDHEVDWIVVLVSVEFMRKKLNVNLLGIVKVLHPRAVSASCIANSQPSPHMHKYDTYPEEGSTCAVDLGHFHASSIGSPVKIKSLRVDLGCRNGVVPNHTPHGELEAGILRR